MADYVAFVRKDSDSDFGVDFPDFPGCISAGKTFDEAVAMGWEALTSHVNLLTEYGEECPEPSDLETLLANPQCTEGLVSPFFVSIPIPSVTEEMLQISIAVPRSAFQREENSTGKQEFSLCKSFIQSVLKASRRWESTRRR